MTSHSERDIAVVGMAGRFPGARSVEQFWENVRQGVESVRVFTDEELLAAGVPRAVLGRADYVKAGTVLEDSDLFDAAFFGFNPREAEVMDPQQRLFLECAWEVLESAGYDPERCQGRVGVYAGSAHNNYMQNVLSNRTVMASVSHYQALLGNDRSFFTTRVCYKLNLTGPSFTVQAACSTSLVAVHLACQHLLDYECDVALAGGASVTFPQISGYFHQPGMILSPDGHCRPFDAAAKGTVAGRGVGVVLLKRLADALADGDSIHAVIKASAVNNDGAAKVGFTAPSVEGQVEVITEALAKAEIPPETLGAIEAHGTGTELGDPIEIAALTQVFRETTDKERFCAIGSLKSNLGHMDAAAGIGGLLKAILEVEHGEIAPSLHFETPNPKLDLDRSPFYVNRELRRWPESPHPRRCGVSAFGIGGTNAHVIVEEPPRVEPSERLRPKELLVLSAKTEAALDRATENLAAHLERHPEIDLADVAYTLSVGRRGFPYRRSLVAESVEDAARVLAERDPKRLLDSRSHPSLGASESSKSSGVAFLFPGQGAQYAGMSAELYRLEPRYREELDRCCDLLAPKLGLDLRELLFPAAGPEEAASASLRETRLTQPALFAVEYAIARLLMGWGVAPRALLGHSIGEYVAACLAGVFSLEDGLSLVAARGRLMQSVERGAMITVGLSEAEIRERLGETVAIAASNAPRLTVLSGSEPAIESVESRLAEQGVESRRLKTSHAFHSEMMDPILDAFRQELRAVAFHPPALAVVSNVTGDFLSDEEAQDPEYWVRQLRQTVRFAEGVESLVRGGSTVLLEIGPGNTLSSLAQQQVRKPRERLALSTLPHPSRRGSDEEVLRGAIGRLWLSGVPVNFEQVYSGERRRRLPLPTYPFERQRFWVAAQAAPPASESTTHARGKKPDLSDWFYVPTWRETPSPRVLREPPEELSNWLLFHDGSSLGDALVDEVRSRGGRVTVVRAGSELASVSADEHTIDPTASEHYLRLLEVLEASHASPRRVVHLWSLPAVEPSEAERLGFETFFRLAKALSGVETEVPLDVAFVSRHLHEVAGGERIVPETSLALGVGLVLSQENPAVSFASYDVGDDVSARDLVADIATLVSGESVAYRAGRRWVEAHEPLRLGGRSVGASRLRERGVYLITGGLGNVGLEAARLLARSVGARLVLLGRSALPARETWDLWVQGREDDHPQVKKIRAIRELEALGAEVVVERADVSDEAAMAAVVERTLSRFGALHGVIHAAASVDPRSMRPLRTLGLDDCERQFAPKLRGTRVLEKLLSDRELDFVLVTSSLSVVLGGLGYAAYAAANRFLIASTEKNAREGRTPWIAVDWDGWDFRVANKVGAAEFAMSPEEGTETLHRILATDALRRVVVSTGDLGARLAAWVKKRPAVAAESPAAEKVAAHHPRPELEDHYVAPRDETERAVAKIWQDLLGIGQIGIHDNFFELGGHSLLATQVIARLRAAFGVELPLRSMFEASTVSELAERVKTVLWARKGQESTTSDDASVRQEIEL